MMKKFLLIFAMIVMALQSFGLKRVLIEEFTEQYCPQCPAMNTFLNNLVREKEFKDVVSLICYHSGASYDMMTIQAHKDYEWFYDKTSSLRFSPAVMADRIPADMMVPYGGNPMPPFWYSNFDIIRNFIEEALKRPETVNIQVKAGQVSSGIMVKVNVKENDIFDIENPHIVVTLCEDGIVAYQANGGNYYTHNHVVRQVNNSWGKKITFDENGEYEYMCILPIDNINNIQETKIVAYIYNNDYPNDRNNCMVANCAEVKYSDYSEMNEDEFVGDDDNGNTEPGSLIKFYAHGNEIQNGDKIVETGTVNENLLNSGTLQIDPEITYETTKALNLDVTVYNTTPTGINPLNPYSGEEPNISICWPDMCYGIPPGEQLTQSANTGEPGLSNNLKIEVMGIPFEEHARYLFTAIVEIVIDGDKDNPFTFDLSMEYSGLTYVNEIIDDSSSIPTIYYDMIGHKIENPVKGQILIEFRGDQTRKIIMK